MSRIAKALTIYNSERLRDANPKDHDNFAGSPLALEKSQSVISKTPKFQKKKQIVKILMVFWLSVNKFG
jgi:hypothetical protein